MSSCVANGPANHRPLADDGADSWANHLFEADWTVQPDGVVQAHRRDRGVVDRFGMVAKGHVEHQVVTRVREHRAVQRGVVIDLSRQPHPVRTGPGVCRPPRKFVGSAMRISTAGGSSIHV